MYIAGDNRESDEVRSRRFELDERAFRNDESEDSFPGSSDSSSTEESDESEPSQEIAPVLGVPIYSPDLYPGRVVGFPFYSADFFPPDLFPGQVVGYPFYYSPDFFPGQVVWYPFYSPDFFPIVGYPIESLVFGFGRLELSPSTRVLLFTLESDPETALIFTKAFILTRLCSVMAFHALVAARRRRFYPF